MRFPDIFTFKRLLERSYLCLFLLKGLIKVLFLVLNETSIIKKIIFLPQVSFTTSLGLIIHFGEGGGGLQNGKIAGPKLFEPPPLKPG